MAIPIFKEQIEQLIDDETNSAMPIIIATTYFPVIFINLLLFSFADNVKVLEKFSPLSEKASAPSYLSFSFLDGLIWTGFKDPITFEKLPKIPKHLDTKDNAEEFLHYWHNRLKKKKISYVKIEPQNEKSYEKKENFQASIWTVIIRVYGLSHLYANLLDIIEILLQFANPVVLSLLINHVGSNEETWKGVFYIMALFACNLTSVLARKHSESLTDQVSLRTRSGIISAIYRKSLKISNRARSQFTVGDITNFMSIDANKVFQSLPVIRAIWGILIYLILAFIFLYREVGVAIFIGMLALLLVAPINIWASKKLQTYEKKGLEANDARIKFMNEILSSMKILKLYAWEFPFMKKVGEVRAIEIGILKGIAWLVGAVTFAISLGPFLCTLTTFAVYVALDPENNVLTASKIFVTLQLFNMMKLPATFLPFIIVESVSLFVSINRINKFMNAEELDAGSIGNILTDKGNAIEVRNAFFKWNDENETETLKDINMTVPKGSLVAVVGTVGCGKTSLLSSLLGEIEKRSGTVDIDGSIAYVPQQAWIQNMTLRDNILFQNELNLDRYENVIKSCALKADLEMLDHGDQTEIGENGINISGGQKQRVSLARAVYADSDIYLLDDPLSAVDAHVGKHIFDEVLSSESGMLKNKTRILVTNSVHFLEKVDNILVIRDGEIQEEGSFKELMNNKGVFSEFLIEYLGDENIKEMLAETDSIIVQEVNNKIEDVNPITKTESKMLESSLTDLLLGNMEKEKPQAKLPLPDIKKNIMFPHEQEENVISKQNKSTEGQLIKDEEAMTGKVNLKVYQYYLRSVGWPSVIIVILLNILGQGANAVNTYWLSTWVDENSKNLTSGNVNIELYLGVYTGLGMIQVTLLTIRGFLLVFICTRAAKIIHEKLLLSMMRSPMSFFDTNPVGRIVNRFSSDIGTIDGEIPFTFSELLWCIIETIITIMVIAITMPPFIGIAIPLMIIYVFIQRYYITTNRQLTRIESITNSPIFAFFTESINGAACIRAYKQEERFSTEIEEKVHKNSQCYYHVAMTNKWLSLRIEFLGILIITAASLLAVFSRDNITAGIAGLAITYSMQIVGVLNVMVENFSKTENNAVSIERVLEYSKNDHEDEWEKPVSLPDNWPTKGEIKIENYQTRYREGLDLVLKGVDLRISSTDKVGICGRTGAGKSSLTLSLFRIIESTNGRILIDDIDISQLGLHQLRSKLTIIPQEPVLFSGTLRFNLDPTNMYEDTEIWTALELSHLKDHVTENLKDGLEHEVSENGQNFSVGQQQLICLARAILRKTKILILDEATAAVDLETDDLIQSTIRTEFSNCTILTIAHRINTIMDSDRIAVFSDGKLIEYDSPQVLINTDGSVFKSLANDAGINS